MHFEGIPFKCVQSIKVRFKQYKTICINFASKKFCKLNHSTQQHVLTTLWNIFRTFAILYHFILDKLRYCKTFNYGRSLHITCKVQKQMLSHVFMTYHNHNTYSNPKLRYYVIVYFNEYFNFLQKSGLSCLIRRTLHHII